MLAPIKWIKEYVDLDKNLMVYTDRLSETGSHVDSVNKYTSDIKSIKVGKVLDIRKHENADKLFVLNIRTDKDVTIVTASKNVKKDDYVLVAQSPTKFDNGNLIEDHEFFGVVSQGMLVSYMELGYPDSVIPKKFKDGVIVLNGEFKEGEKLINVLDSNSPVIEFEITPNRPDCLSIIGLARESAASFDTKIKLPDTSFKGVDEKFYDYMNKVDLKSKSCKRIITRVIKDVTIKDSPQWLQNYLMLAGVRPINNIVDITNFVMLEYGQPLHAYDLDKLNNKTLIVRDARENEVVETLDGVERKLDSSMLVISDDKNAIGIAGIMGSLESEVTEDTKNILLESACFDKDSIRKTSKMLQLRSEASSRFEKGVEVELCEQASNRVMNLVEKLGIGTVINDKEDLGIKQSEEVLVDLRIQRLNLLLGTDFDKEIAKKYLELLEFEIVEESEEKLKVRIPYFRGDVRIEADLIEEIARLYAIKNIEDKPLHSALKQGKKDDLRELSDDLKISLFGQRFDEISTYSFISPKVYDKLMIKDESRLGEIVKIINPLGEDFSVMRTTLISNMLETISKNIKRKQDDLRFYEIGTVFKKSNEKLPYEKKNLCMALFGNYDFYDLKDMFIKSMENIGVYGFDFEKEQNLKTFHKGRCANIYLDGEKVGVIGQISYELRDNFEIKNGAYVLEVELDKILKYRKPIKKYKTLPKYPAIEIDLSLVCDRELEVKNIEDIINSKGNGLIKNIELFDIYTGDQIDKNKKSVSYRLIFRSDDKTLNDEEINPIVDDIIENLKQIGVDLRS